MTTPQTPHHGPSYQDRAAVLRQFGPLVVSLMSEIAAANGIQIHAINYRIKEEESTIRKLSSKEGRYAGLSDLTDILGVRIITYFPEAVDAIAHQIEAEFNIDRENSVDKRSLLDPDRFGYLSLHYVAKLNDERCALLEYRRYADISFEVQIRSILQHAWAEIEHDLGYKTQQAIPAEIRRRFSRLAGLLELADNEFQALRDDLHEYETTVATEIEKRPADFALDQATLIGLIQKNFQIRELDTFIAELFNQPLSEWISPGYISSRIEALNYLGIGNIEELTAALKKRSETIKNFAAAWLSPGQPGNNFDEDDIPREVRQGPTPHGISLFYLAYVLVCELDESKMLPALEVMKLRKPEQTAVDLRRIFASLPAS
ncbi:hypothetical protein ABT294_50165 [Nonomuraea sp. NPDC000554]|uniref:GTP pyrophosphokinase n=1 Tax=Nonomuraea sp. NPDC000554 TaxID=3154259 RepID=UPI00331728EC